MFDGTNWYTYCGNNPTNFCDINGLNMVPDWAKRIGAGKGTVEDFNIAVNANPSAWLGYERVLVESAINRAIGRENALKYLNDYDSKHKYDSFKLFLDALGFRESSGKYYTKNSLGYLGKYQFGKYAFMDIGFKDKDGNWTELAKSYGVNSEVSFLNNPEAQEVAERMLVGVQCRYIKNLGLDKYIGKTMNGTTITMSGLIASVHLVGIQSVKSALECGDLTSQKDGNGVTALEYMTKFGGYNFDVEK